MPADVTGPTRTLDVRSLESPPYDAVVAALGDLGPGETVEIVAGAAPVPLYDALDRNGWIYESVRVAPDVWRVRVTAPGTERRDDRDGETGRSRERRRPRTDRPPRPTHP
ncbi:DUF2249 domain-containing protein [Natronomonas salina]|uniref:DUF2249 domain-containing protein n=1 Tax=Natronomonas salina TaxID=1710540 RepID=UPI0015B55CF1|nr:DUF2249 domain-containing protein [Natronomonas salina]QLD91055.1 DUF2249 domain-containing protein [Natronomonas salina]